MKLHLVSLSLQEPIILDVPSGTRLIEPLRALALEGRIPFSWHCGHGACGCCLVRLEHNASGQYIALSNQERSALMRHNQISQLSPTRLLDTPDLPRLACHVTIETDLIVYLP